MIILQLIIVGLACVQTPPARRNKRGERASLPDFFLRGGERLHTGYYGHSLKM